MTEERDSQLSAMFDGELPGAECELLARRLGREAGLRGQWERYALIGATLRAEPGVPLDLRVARSVSAALAAEPPHGAAGSAETARAAGPDVRRARWLKPAAGLAVAASVAALSILYLRAQAPDAGEAPAVAQLAQPAPAPAGLPRVPSRGGQSVSGGEPESYVVPAAADQAAALATAELANYVVAHSEFSSPLVRRNMLTTLVTGDAGAARDPGLQDTDAVDPEAAE